MSRTDQLADPLISPIASLLNAPLLELYALLWRAGVVEIVETQRENPPRPATERNPSALAAGRGEPAPDRRSTGRG
ncbi:Rv1535 domain-containing protein [Mycobacterium sp. 852002-51163_SCH5372311]|uniref:Rv1535 domain-containing protein n=1 Tax=Mycobacterium sp. 852002-51163_SCH5372311 TaxID=1834097 RepID=UPI0021009D36|nr:Rv1535 domain-containing protein [Mycobacterium sp. 852002-51163_SCH5372311]